MTVSSTGEVARLRLGESTWPEMVERARVLLVPFGSCEQHGPHLPLDTDTRIAFAVAEGIAGASPAGSVVVAPAVGIGASGEHAGFPGTLSVGTAVLEEVAVEVVRSADHFDAVVLVNAHGGNSAALRRAVSRLRAESRRVEMVRCSVPGGDSHAGRTETSLLLHLAPGLVRAGLATAGETRPWSEVADRIVEGGVIAVSPNGVLGDPTGASAEEGARLLAAMVTAGLEQLRDLAPSPPEAPGPSPPEAPGPSPPEI